MRALRSSSSNSSKIVTLSYLGLVELAMMKNRRLKNDSKDILEDRCVVGGKEKKSGTEESGALASTYLSCDYAS